MTSPVSFHPDPAADPGAERATAGQGSPVPQAAAPRERAPGYRRFGVRLLSIAVLLVLWQLAASVTRNPSFIPAPRAVWDQLVLTSTVHDGSGATGLSASAPAFTPGVKADAGAPARVRACPDVQVFAARSHQA
ncbi:hypothetical protein ACOZ38_18475 [Sphaerisporangium viridialbum]|uniref:hypothetical protein n=1 Tax=Sphaerisporangium viridialbum TaxID=46189 RepID=UPI003C7371BE